MSHRNQSESPSQSNSYQLIGPTDRGETEDQLATLEQGEARLRLRALLTQWLQLENLVILAGAGTSVSVGGKLLNDIERSVLDVIAAIPQLAPDAKKLVQARRRSLNKNKRSASSFEDWLSYLSNARVLISKPNTPFLGVHWRNNLVLKRTDIANLLKWIHHAMLMECSLVVPEPDLSLSNCGDLRHSHVAFVSKMAKRDNKLERAHLFTLNYDTAFEQALDLSRIQYFDGFSGRVHSCFDPSVYGLDMYHPNSGSDSKVHRFEKLIHLYKLHGSIHWHERDGRIYAQHKQASNVVAKYRSLNDLKEKASILTSNSNKLPAYMILPTANKYADTLLMPYAHLFREFHARLSIPQTFLLVLGYGFGDPHVNRMIETALTNPSLVMLVVEPDPSSPIIDRVKNYSAIGARAFVLTTSKRAFECEKFVHSTFADFALSILPNVQWLDDFLRVRQFERKIASIENDSSSSDHAKAEEAPS